ncbi:hypothetical protein K7X08_025748 [Anisodus acutangulus]|uniref:Uncharacterized protein n=1 Tax=Anisodus acutangulus TaxID=402998 RepID=A0A9Q1L826_9SOLA|nr:hypothetical protein K7X08_025748 [Anisodus acutangulus]
MKEVTIENNKDADVTKDKSDRNKEIVYIEGDVAKDAAVDVAKDISKHNKSQLASTKEVVEIHAHDQLMVYVDKKRVGSYPPSREEVDHVADNSIDGKEEFHVVDNSMVHVNIEKQITTQRKQNPLRELHDVVSHNIDFVANVDKRTKDDFGNSKLKDIVEKENLEQVFHQVEREAGISPKSMQKGNKKTKNKV